ncbi:hypothetical protein HG537_0H01640 [Torulaspora globosa]|uniref:Uncharacterized protein n=1 Tax=Torulaspora globosa TaxID=48254 RepID=A0A7H9I0T9_9SACH|nr:hypothetical protein HG537_0H01640 [Torulaspora sp. CBS 2947]
MPRVTTETNGDTTGDDEIRNHGRSHFQLPSLPSWRTPKVESSQYNHSGKNHYTTPLRRPSSLLVYHSHQDLEQPELKDGLLDILSARYGTETEYDYQPLSRKPLLGESKIRGFLQSERAAHCLIFHKNAHVDDTDSYRPDIDWECGETDADSEIGTTGSLLQSVPGCSDDELNLLLNRNFMSQRPNVRKYDEILSRKVNGLKRFWGDSDLTTTLSHKHIHEQYRHLTDEWTMISLTKLRLKSLHSESLRTPEDANLSQRQDDYNA